MLPSRVRLTRRQDFVETLRRGPRTCRVASSMVVVHLAWGGESASDREPARVGFVVSKAVGNAVTRNRVRRRLQGAVATASPSVRGSRLVIRALPAAATASYAQLSCSYQSALAAAERRATRGSA